VDCAPISCPSAQHSNRGGDVSPYTLSTKTWGSGITINDYSLTQDATKGHSKPCLRLRVNWTQTAQPQRLFPSIIPPGGAGYEPLFGGWVIAELVGGPQVSLNAGEQLRGVSCAANTKRLIMSPSPTAFAGRYLVFGTPTAGGFPVAGTPFTGGTFTLTVDGEETNGINFDADPAIVQSELESLSTVGAGGVTVTGGLLGISAFLLHFTDGLTHTISGDASLLDPNGGTINVRVPYHFNYAILPVVVQGGVIYGPTPAVTSNVAGGGSIATDVDEPAWRCRNAGATCPPDAFSGGNSVGANNQPVHSRYREFLENPLAYPSGIDVPCQRYCRAEDSFGDWSDATVERWNPTITTTDEFPHWDTWIPATPDFSSGDYTIGFAVAFLADEPGDYVADLLIDNLCLDWTIRPPLPNCDGLTMIVDEPMDTDLPAGWATSILNHDPLNGNCNSPGVTQYFGASWRIEDGWMLTDHVYHESGSFAIPIGDYVGVSPYFWRDRIYAGGSMFKTLGSSVAWKNSNFCLIVECELQRLHEEDAEWTADDEGSPNLNLHRPEEDFGIFIGGLAKFGVIRNLSRPGLSADNHACDRSYYDLRVSGFVDVNGEEITMCQGANYGTYECDDIDGIGTHRVGWGRAAYDTRGGAVFFNQAVPLKTDKLRLQVRWAASQPTIQDCHAELRYSVVAWINDQERFWMTLRHPTQDATVNVSAATILPAWIRDPSVGVYAHRGGKFRNFKAWMRTS
jgi:hypothetical protein